MLGNTYHYLGNLKEEFICYHQAIKRNPLIADNYIVLAQLHYDLGTLDSAEHYFRKGEELGDSKGEAAMGMANIFWDQGKFNRAITKANQAVHSSPKNAYLYPNRADIKFAMEDTLGALEDFNKAVKLSPKSAWMYTSRAAYYFDVENYEACKKNVEKALSIDPKSVEAHYYKAGLLYLEGKEEEAIKTFEIYYKDLIENEMRYIPDSVYN
jgi:tetratricopeptide (TPR) repeat protein